MNVEECELNKGNLGQPVANKCSTSGNDILSNGTRHPAFSGISISSILLIQYITAECTTEIGALRFPRTSQPVPSKSKIADPSEGLISTRRQIWKEKFKDPHYLRRK